MSLYSTQVLKLEQKAAAVYKIAIKEIILYDSRPRVNVALGSYDVRQDEFARESDDKRRTSAANCFVERKRKCDIYMREKER